MKSFNLNNRTFILMDNSKCGKVDDQTIFKYRQKNNLVTADYSGGSIQEGRIVAQFRNNRLHMLYNCITSDNELKAGKAMADVTRSREGKLILSLNWAWLETSKTGRSTYIEI